MNGFRDAFNALVVEKLSFSDVLGCRSAITLLYVECYPLSFGKGFETIHSDRRIMDKNVRSVFLFYEPKSLFVTKPFYNPICHNTNLLLNPFFFRPKSQAVPLGKGKGPLERNRPARYCMPPIIRKTVQFFKSKEKTKVKVKSLF
jgi:hypothetical protein